MLVTRGTWEPLEHSPGQRWQGRREGGREGVGEEEGEDREREMETEGESWEGRRVAKFKVVREFGRECFKELFFTCTKTTNTGTPTNKVK